LVIFASKDFNHTYTRIENNNNTIYFYLINLLIIVFGLYRWWKALDVPSKLPFARDRIVESCFWGLGVCFEPQFYTARKFVTKLIAILTVVDDAYDAYGTIDELELFTEAIERSELAQQYTHILLD
jgi:hypothetical protein